METLIRTDRPLVSILINNYNYGPFLEEAIDSALNQSYSNVEVIVVDDGSIDNSCDIIKSYEKNIIPVYKNNGGQASAFNAGFKVSQGDFLFLLDSDDVFYPEKIEKVVDYFESDLEAGWYYHSLMLLDDEKGVSLRTDPESLPSRKIDFRSNIMAGRLPSFAPATSGLCFRRNLLQKILPMPEDITKVSDYYVKWVALGMEKGFYEQKDLAMQRIHGSNMFTLRRDRKFLDAKILIQTGYWIYKRFPELKKFSDKIFAIGLGNYWQTKKFDSAVRETILDYMLYCSWLEKTEIFIRAGYHSSELMGIIRELRLRSFKRASLKGVD